MVKVDIVSPIGGAVGGIENVILSWIRKLDHSIFDLRVFHCHKGTNYLQGYEKAYSTGKDFLKADIDELTEAYTEFIKKHGAPDICIATNWPMMVRACDIVRRDMGLASMKLYSWIHNRISAYEEEGLLPVFFFFREDSAIDLYEEASLHDILKTIPCLIKE